VRLLKLLGRLYWWRLRTQPVQEALALLGIAAGVALIFAVEIANTSVPASVRQLAQGIAGPASLEVAARSPEGFEKGMLSKIGHAPGVMGAAAALSTRVTLIGPRGEEALTLLGAEPDIGFIGGPIARRFSPRLLASPIRTDAAGAQSAASRPETIALPEGVAAALGASAGQTLSMDVGGRAVAVLCSAVLTRSQVGAAVGSPVAITLLSAAQQITGLEHRATRILILPRPGEEKLARSSLQALVGAQLDVRSSSSEVDLLENATRSSNQAATAFTALSVIVGLLFAYNAMLLTLPARRRFVSRLRGLGAFRSELIALLALETIALGLVASLVGLVLGDLLSKAVFGGVPGYLTAGFAIGTQRVITASAVLISVGGGMLATIVAAVGPAIGSLRGLPLDRPSAQPRASRLLARASGRVGLLAALGAIVVAIGSVLLLKNAGLIAVGVLAVGLGFALAPAVPWLIEASNRLAIRMRSPLGFIATTELRAAPTRATVLAATSAIAVYAIVALGGAANDIRRGVTKTTEDIFGGASVVVTPSSFEQSPFQVQPFAAEGTFARLRTVPAVAWADELRGSFLDVGARRLFVLAKPQDSLVPISASQIIDGSAGRTATLLRQGDWAALSATVAGERHLHLGDPFSLPTPSGYVTFHLAATITNYGWPPGALVMDADTFTRLWQSTDATVVRVGLRSGVSEAQGVRTVKAALSGTGLSVSGERAAAADVKSATNQGLSQLGQISTLLLAAAVLAVIAAMSGSILQRRARLANLKRLGAYRGELVRTIYLETGVVVLIGCLIGMVFGLSGQPFATQYVRQSTGFPEVFSPAVGLSIQTLVLATVLTMLATGLIGFIVTRRSVVWRAVP
jgi:putative ABC transport system permease protein